jgi:chemotaxis protein methyltransferase CheR
MSHLERLYLEAESRLGIKAEEGALEKLHEYLIQTYGFYEGGTQLLDKVFSSGEAARFLTVNETYFFREPDHFSLLFRELLPAFVRDEKLGPGKELRICSAAASLGCEAYSIAMILEQYNALYGQLSYHIDAFDLNPDVILRAREGIYGKNSLREDGSSYRYILDRWLKPRAPGELEVDRALRGHIRFFQHNIMDALPENSYHIIFFRNALIYFSPRSRIRALSNLVSALDEGGILIMGVSETAAADHPAIKKTIDELVTGDVFYFKKSAKAGIPEALPKEKADIRAAGASDMMPAGPPAFALNLDVSEVVRIIADEEESARISCAILEALEDPHGGTGLVARGNELAASVLFLLSRGDFDGAGSILDFIESRNPPAPVDFLRGEYFYLQDMFTEAEFHYKVSSGKNNAFWPAFYRLCSLASEEVLHKHRVQRTLESLSRGKDFQYEVFIGGFSPDYYRGALMKQRLFAGNL